MGAGLGIFELRANGNVHGMFCLKRFCLRFQSLTVVTLCSNQKRPLKRNMPLSVPTFFLKSKMVGVRESEMNVEYSSLKLKQDLFTPG